MTLIDLIEAARELDVSIDYYGDRSANYRVESASKPKKYNVSRKSIPRKRRTEYHCDCENGLTDGTAGGICKHKVAVILFLDENGNELKARNLIPS